MQNIPKFREYRFVGWRVYPFVRKSRNLPILYLKTSPLSLKCESQGKRPHSDHGEKNEKIWKPPNIRPDSFVLENDLPGLQDRLHTEQFRIG